MPNCGQILADQTLTVMSLEGILQLQTQWDKMWITQIQSCTSLTLQSEELRIHTSTNAIWFNTTFKCARSAFGGQEKTAEIFLFFKKEEILIIERSVVALSSPSRGSQKRAFPAVAFSHTLSVFIGNTLASAVRVTAILRWRLSVEGQCQERASSLEVERWCWCSHSLKNRP